jgi:hypothetical protein
MQDNSGGAYIGPQVMFVEADSTKEAEALGQGAGIYSDGVAAEKDCDCCGDRWFRDPDGFLSEAKDRVRGVCRPRLITTRAEGAAPRA